MNGNCNSGHVHNNNSVYTTVRIMSKQNNSKNFYYLSDFELYIFDSNFEQKIFILLIINYVKFLGKFINIVDVPNNLIFQE